MTIDNLNESQIQSLEQELLKLVPADQVIGNVTLKQELHWEEEQYWIIRNRLIDRGILTTGRGRGGSVQRSTISTPDSEAPKAEVAAQQEIAARLAESQLYQPLKEVIESQWVKAARFDVHLVEITARQGARQTGGKWSRPDIAVAGYKTYPWVPGRHFDIVTFEVKPEGAFDVTCVYEALGHLRAATRAYVLLHVPEESVERQDQTLFEILDEAKRHGVGVIVAADPSNFDSWETLVEAVRKEPDPERLNEFIGTQLSPTSREMVVKWFR